MANFSTSNADVRKVPELSLMSYISGNIPEKTKFIDELFTGLKDYGFIILYDHPIAPSLLERAYSLSEQFFSLPSEVKKTYKSKIGGGQRGYTPFGTEHAKDYKLADLKEFWHVGRDLPENHKYSNVYPPNLWPAELPEFKDVFKSIYQGLDEVGRILLSALTGPLRVDSKYFESMIQDGNSILRLLHYPPVPDNTKGALRAAPHEDINLITILVSATASGLQLKDRNGEWLPVVGSPNSLVVDAGDMLSRITNDVIPSTTHQVVNPEGPNLSRYSMPFFIHPHPEAVLSCIPSCKGDGAKYADITSHDFLMQRLKEIGLY